LTWNVGDDLEELRTVLSQTTRTLKELHVSARHSYYGFSGTATSLHVDADVLEIVAECCPRIKKLTLGECNITTGFCKIFSKFTAGFSELEFSSATFSSDDPLEFRYLAEAHCDTLEKFRYSEAYGASATHVSQFIDNPLHPFLGFTGRIISTGASTTDCVRTNDERHMIQFPRLHSFYNYGPVLNDAH